MLDEVLKQPRVAAKEEGFVTSLELVIPGYVTMARRVEKDKEALYVVIKVSIFKA